MKLDSKKAYMFYVFNKNKSITKALRERIHRKLPSFGMLEYAYTVASKKQSDMLTIYSDSDGRAKF